MNEQEPDELLLSYAELGRRLGITADGARVRARRKHWPVIRGNDGQAKVRVLVADLPEHVPDMSEHEPNSLAERIDELRDELHEARQQVEHWRTEAEQARLAAATAKAEAEAQVKITRAEAERDAARAQAQAEARVETIAELRELLAEARRPWWRKLLG
jgi:regulator of protease activity HflC (stomatin/prohibitin superfamily)